MTTTHYSGSNETTTTSWSSPAAITRRNHQMLQRRSTRTRLAVLAVCGSLSLAITACGDDSGTSGSTASGDVAAVIKGLDNPFFQQMEAGIDAADDNVDVDALTAHIEAGTSG